MGYYCCGFKGKSKATMRRIAHQTCCEVEQKSWVVVNETGAHRKMGFEILGAPDAIREAVNAMIRAVRHIPADKSKNIMMSHMRASKPKPKPKRLPQKPRDPRSNLKKHICRFYLKGKCTYGIRCKESHSLGGRGGK